MEAYCFKCKEKREISQAQPGFTSRGAAMTTGICGVCGTKLFRMGVTPAHEGLEKPVVVSTKAEPKKTAVSRKPKPSAKQPASRTSNGKKSAPGTGSLS